MAAGATKPAKHTWLCIKTAQAAWCRALYQSGMVPRICGAPLRKKANSCTHPQTACACARQSDSVISDHGALAGARAWQCPGHAAGRRSKLRTWLIRESHAVVLKAALQPSSPTTPPGSPSLGALRGCAGPVHSHRPAAQQTPGSYWQGVQGPLSYPRTQDALRGASMQGLRSQ